MRVEFHTSQYLLAHGHRPRGGGRWAFCPKDKYNLDNYLDFVMWFTGSTYGEAKRQAAAAFKERGVADVVVCT